MDVSDQSSPPRRGACGTGVSQASTLLLDRPRPEGDVSGAGGSPASSSLYPPGYAGVREVHGDMDAAEEANRDTWIDEVGEALLAEDDVYDDEGAGVFDGERPPNLSPDELQQLDFESDVKELTHLGQEKM